MAEGMNLDAHHQATVERIFRHPVSHNIEWHDVLSLLEGVGTVTRGHDGRFTVTLGSETETFDAPRVERRRRAAGSGPSPHASSRWDHVRPGVATPRPAGAHQASGGLACCTPATIEILVGAR